MAVLYQNLCYNKVCNKGTVVHCYIVLINSNITTNLTLHIHKHHHQFFLNDFAIYPSTVKENTRNGIPGFHI